MGVAYVVFDVLSLDGRRLTGEPLSTRRRILVERFSPSEAVVLNPAVTGQGDALFHEMCTRGVGGVVAKRAASTYQSRRSRDWLKIKCVRRQEFVVGASPSPGAAVGRWARCWWVSTRAGCSLRGQGRNRLLPSGPDRAAARLDQLEQPTSPFGPDRIPERDPDWVRPELVAEVSFSEWTTDGRLRHPTFLGLRDDRYPSRSSASDRPRPDARSGPARAVGRGPRLLHNRVPDALGHPVDAIPDRDRRR